MHKNRPMSHSTGDLAELEVSGLFTSAGWIVNKIHKDYGEDLVVQYCHDGTVFPFRFYVQVKGTRNINPKNLDYNVCHGLKKEALERWFVSPEVILLVIWDTSNKSGVYGFIQDLFDKASFKFPKQPTYSVQVPKANVLKEDTLPLLGMQVVIHWAENVCRDAGAARKIAIEDNRNPGVENSKYTTVGLWILLALDIVNTTKKHGEIAYYINPKVLEAFTKEFLASIKKNGKSLKIKDKDTLVHETENIWLLTLLNTISRKTELFVSEPVLQLTWDVLSTLYYETFKTTFPKIVKLLKTYE
jgi:hypothetical protein